LPARTRFASAAPAFEALVRAIDLGDGSPTIGILDNVLESSGGWRQLEESGAMSAVAIGDDLRVKSLTNR
jgi:hypothetical protein